MKAKNETTKIMLALNDKTKTTTTMTQQQKRQQRCNKNKGNNDESRGAVPPPAPPTASGKTEKTSLPVRNYTFPSITITASDITIIIVISTAMPTLHYPPPFRLQ